MVWGKLILEVVLMDVLFVDDTNMEGIRGGGIHIIEDLDNILIYGERA